MLYLRADLVKGGPGSGSGQSGEQRGGEYTARVQVGTEADGSPRYKYFKDKEEYTAYLKEKTGEKGTSDRSTKKFEDERKKTKETTSKKKESLLVGKPVKKSLIEDFVDIRVVKHV